MKYLLLILSMSILLSGELEVDGDLKVTGTIQNDSLAQVILLQQQRISSLEALIAQLQAQMTNLLTNDDCSEAPGIQLLDVCGVCDGDTTDADNCPNYALSFDGVDDYVNVGNDNDFDIDNTVTIEAWIKPTDLSSRKGIFTTRRDNDSGSFQLEVGTSDVRTNYVGVCGVSTWVAITNDNAISTGEWTHIAYTRSGIGDTSHVIYINGTVQAISTSPYPYVNNDALKEIGRGLNGEHHYNGQIDGIRIWNIALDSAQIQSNMLTELTGNEEGLVGYWNFNEGSGNILNDLSGNGNHGTIHGNPEWVER